MRENLRPAIAFLGLASLFTAVYFAWIGREVRFVSFDDGRFHISDFAYHALALREFFFGAESDPYRIDSLILVFQRLVDPRVREVMPIVVTPVALIAFFPFSLLTFLSVQLAQAVWAGCSLASLILGFASAAPAVRQRSRREQILLGGAAAVFLGSTSFFYTLAIGQTSILFVAASLVLALRIARREPATMLDLLLLIAAATKPTYFGLTVLMLLGSRRFDLLLRLVLLLFVPSVFLFVRLGMAWVPEYCTMFSYYAAEVIPEPIRSSLVFGRMNVLRNAWGNSDFQAISLLWSKMILALCGVASFFVLLRFRHLDSANRDGASLFPYSLLLGGYLLFSPYLSFYEDLLLILMLLPLACESFRSPPFSPLVLLCLLFVSLNSYDLLANDGGSSALRPWLWIGKALFVGGALWYLRPVSAGCGGRRT